MWLSRNEINKDNYGVYNIHLSDEKPKKNFKGNYVGIMFFCPELFHRATKFRLRPGRCKKIKEIIFVKEK